LAASDDTAPAATASSCFTRTSIVRCTNRAMLA